MDEGKLLFLRPHDGTGRLVFGDTGDAGGGAPDAQFGLDGELPGLDGEIGMVWDANVSRGGLRGELGAHWQVAQPVAVATRSHWQTTAPMPTGLLARWQGAVPMQGRLRAHWQRANPLRGALQQHYQEAERKRAATRQHWQEAERLRAAALARYQEAERLRAATRQHQQETLRLRCAVLHAYQQAVPARHAVRSGYEPALPVRIGQRQHWQEAIRPAAGRYAPPVVQPSEPCYDPATLGRLVFAELALGDGRLVFVCQRAGQGPEQPGATVVVPIRRVYVTINALSLITVPGGTVLPASAFTLSLDADSWTWQWSATMHASALPLITPGPGGDPIELQASVNGQPIRLAVEGYTRERRFASTRINVRGRGRAAILDAPYAPVLNFGNSSARTAQQLANEALTINGVGIGWDVDWQLTDWLVPGNTWVQQGSYIAALLDIAEAGGGYVQPHDTAQTLRILPRYPAAPWDWAAQTPDVELPAAVVSVEGTEWLRKAAYNRVYASGTASGVLGRVTRTGTAGDAAAPMVTHPLITHADAARQRGLPVLADTGAQALISLRLPVLAETGLIKPGTLVRYVDAGVPRLGLSRSLQVDWQAPTLRQTISLETHLE